MELDVHDRITADPTPGDIIAAVDARGAEPDWFITLSDDDGYVEAFPAGRNRFRMAYATGKERFDAPDPVDAETLKAVLLACLRGEEGWRTQHGWVRKPTRAQAAATSGEPPTWAVAGVVASVAFIVVVANLPRDWLPFLDTTLGTIALFALPVVVMICAMIANAALKMHKAKNWLPVQAKITRSKLTVRRPPPGNEIGTAVNVPDVTYTFSVQGKSYQGSRVSLGDVSGRFAEEAVRRYPVGATVTIYYDPNDPGNCVIERGLAAAPVSGLPSAPATPGASASTPEARKAALKGCAPALVVLAALGAGGYWLATGGVRELEARLPRAEVPVMLCAIGFGLLTLLFFIGYRRSLLRANAWPVVPGEVTVSRVEERSSSDEGRSRRTYAAVVEFTYEVGGLSFSSRQIALGLEMSGSRSAADKITARYPLGATVEVHYDPANPSQAALENPTGMSWLLFGVAMACFGIALYASRIFR